MTIIIDELFHDFKFFKFLIDIITIKEKQNRHKNTTNTHRQYLALH